MNKTKLTLKFLQGVLKEKKEVTLDVVDQDRDYVKYQMVFLHGGKLWCAYYWSTYTKDSVEEPFSRGSDNDLIDCYRVKAQTIVQYDHI